MGEHGRVVQGRQLGAAAHRGRARVERLAGAAVVVEVGHGGLPEHAQGLHAGRGAGTGGRWDTGGEMPGQHQPLVHPVLEVPVQGAGDQHAGAEQAHADQGDRQAQQTGAERQPAQPAQPARPGNRRRGHGRGPRST
ncbi:hypothetical protein GCM10009639_28730 [Kitasatospora putterlickiae]|uniref:Uncharacterized protein n=1 Tax=Kitasatospora putterlickiae TaxID=221725 RepID=A0ABN1Y0F6_9ACTN